MQPAPTIAADDGGTDVATNAAVRRSAQEPTTCPSFPLPRMVRSKTLPSQYARRQSYSDWRHDRYQQVTDHIGWVQRLNDFRSDIGASLKSLRGMAGVGIDYRSGHKRSRKIG